MELRNYSAEPENRLYGWLPHSLEAEAVVFLPDACPGQAPLPTGTAVLTRQGDWRRFAVSDCGCGMLLLRSAMCVDEFKRAEWDALYHELKANKGGLGNLGSGNHFLDALQSYADDLVYFLVHTGSRDETRTVEPLVDMPDRFDAQFAAVCKWARANRLAIARLLQRRFGPCQALLDQSHNSFEPLPGGGSIVRKGTVHAEPGDLAVIPSSMNGDVALVRAKEGVRRALWSLSHGTGRVMSRSEAKAHADAFDYAALRRQVYIPATISDASIRTEAPFCYRDLDACLGLIGELCEEVERFAPFAYLGQV
ncbi:MAG TPA: RtcB family protein [Anaerolineae bacterium]|nr:RtcB family protein [Anaerolineae bacterium]HPL29820.1 RtcB family protein [Anaerolineae bacterium]